MTDLEEIKPFESEAPLIIYIDFKSPYAYLSVAPTREMLSKQNDIADCRKFDMDIPSYLGTDKLDKGEIWELTNENNKATKNLTISR